MGVSLGSLNSVIYIVQCTQLKNFGADPNQKVVPTNMPPNEPMVWCQWEPKAVWISEPVGGSGIWNLNLPPNEPKGWCMDIRTSSGARLSEPGTGSCHMNHLLVLVKACSHALQNWYENMGNPHPYTSQMWVTH